MRRLTFPLLVTAAIAVSGVVQAQSVISARAGLVHYTEGEVLIGDKAIDVGDGKFAEVKPNEVLRTGYGRAEVLLTPGSFLRLSENSSVRMLTTKLTDARVEALSGDLLIEYGDENKEDNLTLTYKDKVITFKKGGIYRLNAEEGIFRVYSGEATVAGSGENETTTVKEAREVELNASVLSANKFDNRAGDPFFRWASQRAGYIATANLSAARTMRESGRFLSSGVWSYNPWFNMYTYVPYGGMWYSPFGYSFWSPASIGWMYYVPYSYWNRGYNGYSGGGGGRSNPSMGAVVPSRTANRSAAVAMGRSARVSRSGQNSGSMGGFGASHGGFGGPVGFGGGRGGYSGGGSMSAGSVSAAPAATGASAAGGGGASHGGGHR